jgi:hypothetical protein
LTYILAIAHAAGKRTLGRYIPSVHAASTKVEPNPTKVLFRERHNPIMLEMASVRL